MRRGFTLIELLIAMGLVVILAGTGVASVRKAIQRKTVENAASDVAEMFRKAQTYAASGSKFNCVSQSLKGWQVVFYPSSDNRMYSLQEVCSDDSTFTTQDGTLPPGTFFSVSTTAPILFKVLGQGVSFGSGWDHQPISIDGYGVTQTVSVGVSGEVAQATGYVFATPLPSPAASCSLITRCSATNPGETASYIPTNPTTCTTVPLGGNCAGSYTNGCTVGTTSCICRQYKSCCTTVLGAAGQDCLDQTYTTIFSKDFTGGAIKIGDATWFKYLRIRFTTPQTGQLGYCTGLNCSTFLPINYTNQTLVSLPTSTNNQVVKISMTCSCTVVLEGIKDANAPPPSPPAVLLSVAGPVNLQNAGTATASYVVDATTATSLQLNFSWEGSTDSTNTRNGYVDYCAGSNCTNFTNLDSYVLNGNSGWSPLKTFNLPVDYTLVTIRFWVDNPANHSTEFDLKDISLTGVKIGQ